MRQLIFLASLVLCGPGSLASQTLVVLNKNDATAQLFDVVTGRTLALLPTGVEPHEVAVSPDGKLAVVSDYGSARGMTLTVIDLSTRTIARTIPFAPRRGPHGIRFLSDNRTVVVTAERSGVIVTIDAVTGAIKGEKSTGQTLGHMVVMSPDEKTAYVANVTPGTLSIVDYAGVADPVIVKVSTQTEAINLTPDGKMVWMGSNNTGKVFIVDPIARKVIDSIQTKGTPYRIAFTPDSKTALVVNPDSDFVQIIDVATHKIRNAVSVAIAGAPLAAPFGIAVAADGKTAWITLSGVDKVIQFDVATGRVLQTLNTGHVPDGIALTGK